MVSTWEALIKHYAAGRAVCNCGGAYYTEPGERMFLPHGPNGSYIDVISKGRECRYGCQANQYTVKNDIARRVLVDLGLPVPDNGFQPYEAALKPLRDK